MEKPPAFQFYPKDFLEGTAYMSNAETGAYIRLLCHQWSKNALENEREVLIRLCQGDEQGLDIALKKFQKIKGGKIANKRLQSVRKNQNKSRNDKANAGLKGAEKRWKNNKDTKNPQKVFPTESSLSRLQHPKTDKKVSKNDLDNEMKDNELNSTPIVSANVLPLANSIAKDSSSSSTSSSIKNTTTNVVVEEKKKNDLFFEMFRRVAGKHISDEELRLEVARFNNKNPNMHPNQAGALINAWVANIGRIKSQNEPEKFSEEWKQNPNNWL